MAKLELSSLHHTALVFIFAVSIITIQLVTMGMHIPYADNVTYMAVALPLYETGIFEDGNFKNTVLAPAKGGEGMFFAPLYPTFLSVLMVFSDSFTETARCVVEHVRPVDIERNCTLNFTIMWAAQTILGGIATVFVWCSAKALFENNTIAWLSVFLILSLANFSAYAHVILLEALIQPLFYALSYFLIMAIKTHKIRYAFLFGVTSGLLILTKSSFIYMTYFLTIIGSVIALIHYRKELLKKSIFMLMVATLSTAVIVGPWVARNYNKIGVPAITFGYGAFTLAQRVAYNDMTAKEWWIGWIYGIPSEGDAISEILFERADFERWEFDNPIGFYQIGNRQLRHETLAAAGSHEAHLGYLVENYVMADLVWHSLVTLPIVFRGMWVFDNWLFFPYLALLYLCFKSLRQRNYLYIFYALPPWFMLGLHGFASVNVTRYNIILQGCLAIALGYCMYQLIKQPRFRVITSKIAQRLKTLLKV